MVDAADSKSVGLYALEGSSPSSGTFLVSSTYFICSFFLCSFFLSAP